MKHISVDKISVGAKYMIHSIQSDMSNHVVRVQNIHIPTKPSKYPKGLCSLRYLGPCAWPKVKEKTLYLTDYSLTWELRYLIE